ncbi:MAG: plastocyanin/azurin family copper-binding protein [Pyrinomonadaceae bacterium]
MTSSLIGAVLLLAAAAFSSLPAGPSSFSAPRAAQASATNTVTLTNFQFSPKSLTIKAGSEVKWEVKEGTHNITADKGIFESQTLSAGQKFSHKFEKPGTYRYYCTFHGSKGGHEMAGTVIVTR